MPRRSAPGPLARSLGARVRHLREEANITQEKLAWDCGFAKGFLSQVEAGKSMPSLAALVALAKRLGVDPIDVLATDLRKPLHRVVDAVRRTDRDAIQELLGRLDTERASATPGSNRQAAENDGGPRRNESRSADVTLPAEPPARSTPEARRGPRGLLP